ncbi:hypothetical protein [Nocardia jejuensis]|uniref:hypothetical protein n=1 Tax=Nocardia jejuensis TaxID=328049 RepID=UPI000B277010|nr:hypothetical protein [Nocardia jejuensis]
MSEFGGDRGLSPAIAEAEEQSGRRRRARSLKLIALVIAATVVCAGTAVAVYVAQRDTGSEGASTSAAPAASSIAPAAPSPLDSFTWDPCGYVSPELFDGVAERDSVSGQLRVQINATSFDDCEIHVVVPGSTYQEVLVLIRNHQAPPDPGTYDGNERFSVVAEGDWSIASLKQQQPGNCLRSVYSSRSWVWISAALFEYQRGSGIDVCALVDPPTNALLGAIRTASTPRLTFPADSLARVDVCKALTDAEVTANVELPGWNPPVERPAAHSCTWKATVPVPPSSVPPSLVIDYNQVLIMSRLTTTAPTVTQSNEIEANIGGRRGIVRADSSLGCSATVVGKTWQPWPGKQVYQARTPLPSTLVESVSVSVTLANGRKDEACQIVQALAAKAWPRII